MGIVKKKTALKIKRDAYRLFDKIDGNHPFKTTTSFSFVEYQARKRLGGSVTFFNFALAKEMGLISSRHEEKLNKTLIRKILDTFAITIINEYDIENNIEFPEDEILDRKYMATRYLQLQNQNKNGKYSGDGRSIWNGFVKSRNGIWDVTSCGTGATCLSPATKEHNKFFQTGDPTISYGCGYSTPSEGIVDVVFSEMLRNRGVRTERVLCVLTFEDGYSIKVRAAQNLMRPSHMFAHLRQNQVDRLKQIVDYSIDRDVRNKRIKQYNGPKKYDMYLDEFTERFADIAALFEQEYIFCWLDWDGDNIMVDGGLLDFGSIRQFGVFHHEYKFDDDGRWSTNIKQQLEKAKLTVHMMAQAIDYIKTDIKKPLSFYATNRKLNKRFDKLFTQYSYRYFLRRLGYEKRVYEDPSVSANKHAKDLFQNFRHLELKKMAGLLSTPDGKNAPVVYNMRGFARMLHEAVDNRIDAKTLLQKSLTDFALSVGRNVPMKEIRIAEDLITSHKKLMSKYKQRNKSFKKRSGFWNPQNRITGDGVCEVADYITAEIDDISPVELYKIVDLYLKSQREGRSIDLNYFDLNKKQNDKIKQYHAKIEEIISCYVESI